MNEAGVSIIGGHNNKDKEPKFGFAVMGTIHPKKILHNAMAWKVILYTHKKNRHRHHLYRIKAGEMRCLGYR